MIVLKWICFILVCLEALAYVAIGLLTIKSVGSFIGLLIGAASRIFVLYGAAAYWLFD